MKKDLKKIFALGCVLIAVLVINYYVTDFEEHASKEVVSNVKEVINIEETEDMLSIDKFQMLQEYYGNTDIRGIVSIDGVEGFSYPVTQTIDNEYYLNHDYYKQYDAYGAIYADYRSNLEAGRKILIFGHSSTKRDVPFNELEEYYDEDYYDNHKYITLETETNTYRYEIFSVYVETSDFTYMNMNFDTDKDWFLHILGLQKKSLYSIDVDLNMDDDILILQTCSNNSKYRKYEKKYLLIVSRRVK